MAPFFAAGASAQVTFDRHCLTINGQDTFIYSGAFHYFRCPKELWRDRLQKMKDAGLNCVETYVSWNVHEIDEPSSLTDFSKVDLTDLKDFLKLCHDEFGFYTIIRPGPYICAEWKGGGYPRWILNKKPAEAKQPWLRSDEAAYLDWSRHWYKACVPYIATQQVTHRKPGTGGTILFQIENEYDYYGVAGPAKINHLRALYTSAKESGINVPIMGCWTRELRNNTRDDLLKNCFDGSNCYPRGGLEGMMETLRKLRNEQPNAPVMIPEMQGGWFSEIGQGTLSEQQPWLTAAQIHNLTLGAIMHDVTIANYYMFFGGTNLGDGASTNITNTYDYGAPLREHGGIDARYFAVQGIGQMLQKHGPALARAEAVAIKTGGDTRDVDIVVRKAKDGSQYAFFRNTSERSQRGGAITVTGDNLDLKLDLKLAGWEARVLYLPPGKTTADQGEWIGDATKPIERPKIDVSPIRIASALSRTDDAGAQWKKVEAGSDLLSEGVTDSRPILYRGTINLTADQLEKASTLSLTLAGPDPVVAQVNGKIVFLRGGVTPSVDVRPLLKVGANEINLLLENQGMPHWSSGMDRRPGVLIASLAPKSAAGQPVLAWRVKEIAPRAEKLVGVNVNDSDWDKIELDQRTTDLIKAPIQPGAEPEKWPAARVLMNKQGTATYRTTLELTAEQLKAGQTQLRFDCIDDQGEIFINGQRAGDHDDWATPCDIDGSKLLKEGKNLIAVVVRNREGQGGLTKGVRLLGTADMGPKIAMQFAPQTIGWRDWTKSAGNDGWKSIELDTRSELPYVLNGGTRGTIPTEEASSLLTWYAVDFDLPAKTAGVWFPWQARMNLSGNAFIFVNGHCLGRYWEVGPQREFFLPDCWLNYGGKNRITLMVRPTEHGAKLTGMEILPKTDFAEKR